MQNINKDNWWEFCHTSLWKTLSGIWLPVGNPGYSGAQKGARKTFFDDAFGQGCWRESHIVRGRIVSTEEALHEYEQSYRVYLHNNPQIVNLIVEFCGNVYDYDIENTHDADYEQPSTRRNHYQDIVIRRIISEIVNDQTGSQVTETKSEEVDLIDLTTGQSFRVPRARGFRGKYLMQVRGPGSPGFFLSPAVVPVHDPSLCTVRFNNQNWYLVEGCGYLSIEAFWQSSKVIEVRYDRYLELKNKRKDFFAHLP